MARGALRMANKGSRLPLQMGRWHILRPQNYNEQEKRTERKSKTEEEREWEKGRSAGLLGSLSSLA